MTAMRGNTDSHLVHGWGWRWRLVLGRHGGRWQWRRWRRRWRCTRPRSTVLLWWPCTVQKTSESSQVLRASCPMLWARTHKGNRVWT